MVFVLVPVFSQGQEQNFNWYFGDHAALDFNSGAPVSVSNGMTDFIEATASISNSSGDLLFYCDSMLWNAQHQPMLNGGGLYSSTTSTQACLILPLPGSSSIYYVVTTPRFNWEPVDHASYSIVDMSMDGGLGAVVQKNIFLMDSSSEKLSATLHDNGTDYWVLLHRMGSDAFAAYLLTENGFSNAPVVSNTGAEYPSNTLSDGDGYLRFSNDGSVVANANRKLDQLEFFHFDNSMGSLSDRIVLDELNAYGVDFSSSDEFLYCTSAGSVNVTAKVLQYDVSSFDSAQIANSRVQLYEVPFSSDEISFAVALAPDSKVYLARYFDTLGVVHKPNLPGLACDYDRTGLVLTTGLSRVGLPNFIKKYAEAPDAIGETAVPIEMNVFPVPAKESVVVEIPDNWQGTALRIELFDQRGRSLRNKKVAFAARLSIERQGLESGIYQGAFYANGKMVGVFRVVFE